MVTMFKSEEVKNWTKIAKIEPENKKDKLADVRTRNTFWAFVKGVNWKVCKYDIIT